MYVWLRGVNLDPADYICVQVDHPDLPPPPISGLEYGVNRPLPFPLAAMVGLLKMGPEQ
jgi:hypothetical protein